MSFCAPSASSSSKEALLQSGPADGDAASSSAGLPVVDATLVDESHRVQQAVHKIQLQISAIQRETNRLVGSAANACVLPEKQAVQNAFRLGQECAEEGKRLLEGGGQQKASDLGRLKKDKLLHNLTCAASGLEAAWKQYSAAYEEKKADVAAAAAKAAAAESFATTTAEGSFAPSSSSSSSSSRLQQVQADATAAEIETHAVMAAEYTQDVARVAADMRSLQQCMTDLARLTHTQGEQMGDIEANMRKGADATEGATEQLTLASLRQQRNMKYLCGLIVAATLFATLAVTITANRS